MSRLRQLKCRADRLEVPKGAIVALCASILALPAAGVVGAHNPKYDSGGGWQHAHTTTYTACNYVDQNADLATQVGNARTNWFASTYAPTLLSLPHQNDCHPGSGAQTYLQLQDAYYGNTGWRASSANEQGANAYRHFRHTHINFNLSASWTGYTGYERRALVCKEIGQVIGVERVFSAEWAGHGQDNDCMSFGGSPSAQVSKAENATNYTYTDRPGEHSRDLLDGKYGAHKPQLTLSGALNGAVGSGALLTEPAYDLSVVARDGFSAAPDATVKSIEIKVDGVRKAYTTHGPCGTPGSCEATLAHTVSTDAYSDGQHQVSVIAEDQLGYSNVRSLSFEIERPRDVFHAQEYTADPATGGQLLAETWAEPGTARGRLEEPEMVTTRDLVPCSGDLGPGTCEDVRSLEVAGPAGDRPFFSHHTSERINDPHLDDVTASVEPELAGLQVVATGPIESAIKPWQELPPQHGSTFKAYDLTEVPAEGSGASSTTRLWTDASTGRPLKRRTTLSDGTVVDESFWTYDQQTYDGNELPDHFFRQPPPSSPGDTEVVKMYEEGPTAEPSDVETGDPIAGYSLGLRPSIAGLGTFCRVGADVVEMTTDPATVTSEDAAPDPEFLGDDPGVPETFVAANYREISASSTCSAGSGSAATPELSVVTMSSESTSAEGWALAYELEAEAIEADPSSEEYPEGGTTPVTAAGVSTTAYAVPGSEGDASVLLEINGSTVVIHEDDGPDQSLTTLSGGAEPRVNSLAAQLEGF